MALLAAPDETAKVMTPTATSDRDIGTMDERGYFKIVDRKKAWWWSAASRSSEEVEDVVAGLDGVHGVRRDRVAG